MKPYKSLFILTELYHIEKFGSVKLMASDEKDIKFLINLLNRIKSKYNFRITTTFVNEIRVVNDEEVVKILGSKFGKDLYMAHFVGGRIKKILLRKKYIERSEKEVERTFIHEYVHAVDYYYKYKISDELKEYISVGKYYLTRRINEIINNDKEFAADLLTDFIMKENDFDIKEDQPELFYVIKRILKTNFKLDIN